MFEGLQTSYRKIAREHAIVQAIGNWITVRRPLSSLLSLLNKADGEELALTAGAESDYVLLRSTSHIHPTEQWSRIVDFQDIELWKHNTSTNEEQNPWGMSQLEAVSMLGQIRDLMRSRLLGNESHHPTLNLISGFSKQSIAADVAVWVDGYERGSQVVWGNSFKENLENAAIKVLFDARFRSLSIDELERARISVTALSDLSLPCSIFTHPSHSCAYAALEENRIVSIFLPAVFNLERLPTMADVYRKLIDKASLSPQHIHKLRFVGLPTLQWIESSDHSNVLEFYGNFPLYHSNPRDQIISLLHGCVAWIKHNVDSEGYIPITFDKKFPGLQRTDIARTALLGFSCALYAQSSKDPDLKNIADRIGAYIDKEIARLPEMSESVLPTLYRIQHLCVIKNIREATDLAMNIMALALNQEKDPILLLQTARTLQLLESAGVSLPHSSQSLVTDAVKRFKKSLEQGEMISLASWAELITILHTANHPEAMFVQEWYLAQQHGDGAFPNTPSDAFKYTRGTGKIIESLAATGSHRHSIERGMSWIAQHQYTPDTSYHVPAELTETFFGGIRHDALNADVWSDSIAHALIAGARYLDNYSSDTIASA